MNWALMTEKRSPAHTITFLPSGETLRCEEHQTIVESALQQGIVLPVSCENGICQVCQAEYVSGQFAFRNSLGRDILERNNQVLCCVAQPRSDCQLVMTDVFAPYHKPEMTLACQISSVQELSGGVYQIHFLAPAGKAFDYWPGQYLLLHVEDENGQPVQLPYSIASAPGSMTGKDERQLELHIAVNSELAEAVLRYVQQAVVVRATLPFGECVIHSGVIEKYQSAPVLMVASGTGFSQIKSLIEGVLSLNPKQEIHLYWSNHQPSGFYLPLLPKQWAEKYEHVYFHPIIERHSDGWHGRSGLIYQVILEDFKDLSHVQMFACGSPNMVYGTLDHLAAYGLSEENMHSDVFSYAPRK